eukprot:TRINITY_DN8198_c0_g1_i1.p1 TRINITY_DN8198_c0_g1~~TRINITY_DN8198_c0_g1_i1.p1  ORF type:complete len:348 (-),score=55.55 TRINITY_DN8198_c0_g1_i1:161-1204(-)
MATMGGNLQGQVSELMSSMPINNSAISDFSQDTKNPLKSLSHDLMPMPLKSLSMAGGMFSSSSSTLFGPRTLSSTSSCLQLSGNTLSSGFDGLTDSKSGHSMVGSAHMSATALLQKAAQMGASASSNINSPMMQRNFVAGMAGPDQLSSIRPYGSMQHQSSFDQIQSQSDQSQLVGVDGGGGGFSSQFLHKNQHDMSSQFFDSAAENSGINEMGMFNSAAAGLFVGGDQHHGFMKSMEHENSGSSGLLQGRSVTSGLAIPVGGRNPAAARFGGGGGGGDMMTLDFLGVGGTRSLNLYEKQQPQHQQEHQEQQESMEFEGVSSQQRLHQYQQQLSHGQSGIEKHIWDV